MNRKVIAVLGISGVGKSSMIRSYVEEHPGVQSVSASELLKRQLSENNTETFRTAASSKIHSNQEQLVSAFHDFRGGRPNQHIIFDGHSIVDNDEDMIIIPTAVFKAIAPDLIVFIEDYPEVIAMHRNTDTKRSRPKRTVSELTTQQSLAKKTAQGYGDTLVIPCHTVRSGEHEMFEQLLTKYFFAAH